MPRLIDADALYEQLKKDEEMARKRVLDTESSLPYPNNLNPSYTRYVAQMDERTRLKHMVADAPTIEERKRGEWLELTNTNHTYVCSVCGRILVNITDGKNTVTKNYPFCHCGADMRGGQDDSI